MDAKEVIAVIRTWTGNAVSSVVFWFKRYRPWVFSGLTVLTILLVVWARFGFTFQVGQFFAAPSTQGVLTVQCSASGNSLSWTLDSSANTNQLQRGNTGTKNSGASGCGDYFCWLPSQGFAHQTPAVGTPATYTDSVIDQGVCYEYRVKYQAQVESNSVFCPQNCNVVAQTHLACQNNACTSVSGAGANTCATNADCASAESLECAPESQRVEIGQRATLTVSGGSSVSYSWSAPDGRPSSGTGKSFDVRFDESGTYDVEVLGVGGAGDEASRPRAVCKVRVQEEEEPTPTPEPGELSIFAEVRNLTENGTYRPTASGRPGQQFQVHVVITVGGNAISNVTVGAPLPPTVTYVAGSTTIGGSPTSANTITSGGLPLGTVSGTREITYIVQARSSGELPAGPNTSVIENQAAGDDAQSLRDDVTLVIDNGSVTRAPSQVPTGPGDVTLLALMSAALVTLLYVSYTHTALYRSREVGAITGDKDHMDFKN